jgi:phosphohistidine swiveling domain-containing protein
MRDRWLTDWPTRTRFPHYTRANAGKLMAHRERTKTIVHVLHEARMAFRELGAWHGHDDLAFHLLDDELDAYVADPDSFTDVLVAPNTDPSRTPLLMSAGAVVGGPISHAVIVSRELAVPCVVSVTDGTRTIPDGALVEVDGTNGLVTILDAPGLDAAGLEAPGSRADR